MKDKAPIKSYSPQSNSRWVTHLKKKNNDWI